MTTTRKRNLKPNEGKKQQQSPKQKRGRERLKMKRKRKKKRRRKRKRKMKRKKLVQRTKKGEEKNGDAKPKVVKGKGKEKEEEIEKEKEKEVEDTKKATSEANKSDTSSADWKWDDTLMYWESPDIKHSEKLAMFDYDGCLANTSLFKKGPDAWSLLFPSIPAKLLELHQKGYKLVIMTNQSDIGKSASSESRAKQIAEKVGRLSGFVQKVGLPFLILVATAKAKAVGDKYRKPATGMWTFAKDNNGGIAPNKAQCFFVGDAAGRNASKGKPKDHSAADKEFAQAAGLTFFTEDGFFVNNAKYD